MFEWLRVIQLPNGNILPDHVRLGTGIMLAPLRRPKFNVSGRKIANHVVLMTELQSAASLVSDISEDMDGQILARARRTFNGAATQ